MKQILLSILILTCTFTTFAQELKKPTLENQIPTEEQSQLIERGTKLHDNARYNDAITLYKIVLDQCPNCALAMYEMALSYYISEDFDKSLEFSKRASQYQTRFLPLVYTVMAGSVYGKSKNIDDSISIYEQAIKIVPNSPELRFNLGRNYSTIKDHKNARKYYKEAIEQNFNYAPTHIFLADLFNRYGYKIPAMMAASRVLATETGTARSKYANELFQKGFAGGATKNSNDSSTNIFINVNSPKDEGDFDSTEMFLSLRTAVKISKDKDDKEEESKTEDEKFADSVKQFVNLIENDKKNQKTFVGKNYFPFFIEMKKNNYVEAFAYWILKQNGSLEADKWILNNPQKTIDFVDWAKNFSPK